METTQSYYINKIKEDLSLKQRANPHYSLRAYARDLGLHSSTLSQVLKGKRPLPIKNAGEIVKRLGLGPKEKTLFLESLYRTKTKLDDIEIEENDDRFMLDESYYKVIAEWEHYVVLDLYDVKNFELSTYEIARRLDITENRADVVLNNLLMSGLLKHDENGKIIRTHATVRTTEDVPNMALDASHLETLEMGKNKLEQIEKDLRDFSSTTVAIDLKKIPEAKTIIREFRKKMAALLRDGDEKTDVYQLAIQFYPMTKLQNKTEML